MVIVSDCLKGGSGVSEGLPYELYNGLYIVPFRILSYLFLDMGKGSLEPSYRLLHSIFRVLKLLLSYMVIRYELKMVDG